MKNLRVLLLFCFFLATSSLYAELMDPTGVESVPLLNYDTSKLIPVTKSNTRDNEPVPDYEFVTEPQAIMKSYYDYMPGSYEGFALRRQTDYGNGTYLTWFGKASWNAERHQYWAYADENCNIDDEFGTISGDDQMGEGFGGIAIHPGTGNCLATWYQNPSGSSRESTICFDDFNLLYEPGFWSLVTVIPAPLPDQYIWPYFWVGPSETPGYVRLYVTSKNRTLNEHNNPCEDMRIMYMDIENDTTADMSTILDLNNWTTRTPMYYWRAKSCRPLSQCFVIDYDNPGHVAIMGNALWVEGDLGDMPVNPGFYIWDSWDNGDTWEQKDLHGSNNPEVYLYTVDNIPKFKDNNGAILDELEVFGFFGIHNNAHFDSDGNAHITCMQGYGFTDNQGVPYNYDHFLPQAEAVWDGSEWTYREVPEMPGIDPLSGHSVPWKIVGQDTLLYATVTWNKYPPGDNESLFDQNVQRSAINRDKKWMVQLWSDGTGVQLAEDGEPGWQAYATHPILYLSISNNNGETWSEVIQLTDIYSTEYDFSDQITVYPNICDEIEDLGDGWGLVHLYYYDDNAFGSYVLDHSSASTGGQITYCPLKIRFDDFAVDPEQENPISLVSNYPNPFFETTTINFTAKKAYQEAAIKIYNPKGQLINTLQVNQGDNPSEGYGIWNGKDLHGKDAANGIYLYKVEIDGNSYLNKMLLTR